MVNNNNNVSNTDSCPDSFREAVFLEDIISDINLIERHGKCQLLYDE